MFRVCEKYCKSWNCRIYHAVNEQPGNYLLQQCTVCYRRRYLYLCNDDHIQCTSACGNPIYAINEGTSPILSYNYGARRPSRVRKSICVMAAMILILYRSYVECYHFCSWCIDPCIQFGCLTCERFRSCIESIFCCVYLYGSAVYWTDSI